MDHGLVLPLPLLLRNQLWEQLSSQFRLDGDRTRSYCCAPCIPRRCHRTWHCTQCHHCSSSDLACTCHRAGPSQAPMFWGISPIPCWQSRIPLRRRPWPSWLPAGRAALHSLCSCTAHSMVTLGCNWRKRRSWSCTLDLAFVGASQQHSNRLHTEDTSRRKVPRVPHTCKWGETVSAAAGSWVVPFEGEMREQTHVLGTQHTCNARARLVA